MNKLNCGGFYYDSSTLAMTKTVDGKPLLKVKPILEKVTNYLYEVEISGYDYAEGLNYVKKYKAPMCSVVRKGEIIGRNFDWYYGEEAEIVVRTKAYQGRHATIGVAHSNLTDAYCNSGEWDDYYNALPFMVTDCINDVGVYSNINVVAAGDKGYTIGTNPNGTELCQIMIPRYVCDCANSAKHAIDLLRSANIYAPLNGLATECHAMICDSDNTYVVEFVDNNMVVYSSTDVDYAPIPNDKDIMVNFYLDGWSGEIKSVCLGDDVAAVAATGLTDHASGLERYNILSSGIDTVSDVDDMAQLMASVKYTNTYNETQDPIWYSEFNNGDLTIYSGQDDYADILTKAIEEYNNHERNKKTWFTAHTSIYEISDKKLTVYVNEDYEHKYEFKLQIAGKLS